LQFLWRVKCNKAIECGNFNGMNFVHDVAL
jgi:hypothetical protein